MPVAIIEPIVSANQNISNSMMTVYTPGNHFNSTGRVNKITFDVI